MSSKIQYDLSFAPNISNLQPSVNSYVEKSFNCNGVGIILNNKTITEGSLIYFDNDTNGIPLIPNSPILHPFKYQIKIRLYYPVSFLTASDYFNVTYKTPISLTVFTNEKSFYQFQPTYNKSDIILIRPNSSIGQSCILTKMNGCSKIAICCIEYGYYTHTNCYFVGSYSNRVDLTDIKCIGYISIGFEPSSNHCDHISLNYPNQYLLFSNIFSEDSLILNYFQITYL
jgi:hypothetical protein